MELEPAHRWFAEHKDAYAVSALDAIETTGGMSSFLVRDPDLSWWEIAAES